jgi:NhaP-type Na+/H+ or K+/H+ antiporter
MTIYGFSLGGTLETIASVIAGGIIFGFFWGFLRMIFFSQFERKKL